MEPAADTLVASSDKTPEPADNNPEHSTEPDSVIQETPAAQRFRSEASLASDESVDTLISQTGPAHNASGMFI